MSFKTNTKEYQNAHTACPKCNGLHIESTTAGIGGEVDTNSAYCHNCKWKGIVHDLVPEKKDNNVVAS